jgi:hypothetical protein
MLLRVSSKSYMSGQYVQRLVWVFIFLTPYIFASARISCLILNFASAVARMDLTLLHSASTSMMRWVAIGTCPATMIQDSISVMVIAERCVPNCKQKLSTQNDISSLWVSIAGQLSTKVTRKHQHLILCLRHHPVQRTQLLAAVFQVRLLRTRRHRR